MFCKICGNELKDGVYVCPNCGCLASSEKGKAIMQPKEKGNAFDMWKKVLLIVSFGLSCLALMLMFAGIAYIEFYESLYIEEGYYADWIDGSIYVYFADAIYPAFIMASLALVSATTSFILGLLKKDGEPMWIITLFNFMFTVAIWFGSFWFIIA